MNGRSSGAGWFIIFAIAALALYLVKYRVQDIKDDVDRLEAQLEAEDHAMRMLRAEWAYLNRPDRLQKLSDRYLKMQKLSPEVVVGWEAVQTRPHAVASAKQEAGR